MTAERFQPDLLVEQACELAGSDDFGDDDTWRDGLARLSEGLVYEARLNDLGVEIAVLDIIRPLTSRLQIVIPEGAGLCQHVVDQWFCWLSASGWAAPGKDRGQDGAPAA